MYCCLTVFPEAKRVDAFECAVMLHCMKDLVIKVGHKLLTKLL